MELNHIFIPIEILYEFYSYLDIKSIHKLSRSCKLFLDININNNQLWKKLLSDLVNTNDNLVLIETNHKKTYELYFKVNRIKIHLKMDNDDLITIYNTIKLNLSCNRITSIPSEIGQLAN